MSSTGLIAIIVALALGAVLLIWRTRRAVSEKIETPQPAPAPAVAHAPVIAPEEALPTPLTDIAYSAETPMAAAAEPAPIVEKATVPTTVATGSETSARGSSSTTTLKGLGPKVATRLAELGIATVADLAALSDAQAHDLDAQLGTFQGRMARDRWIEQARLLTQGDLAGFEAMFGKLGG